MDPETVAPRIIVTEPSPIMQTTVSVAGTTGSNSETPKEAAKSETTAVTVEPTEVSLGTEKESTGEFATAEECGGCVVSVSEPPSHSVETTTGTSEPDQDDFRNASVREFYQCGGPCMEYYERILRIMHSAYAIPVWIGLLALPLSAGVIGALYMYSCPASHSTTTMMFTMGVSLMALISLRVCLIVHEMTSDNLTFRNTLHTLLLTATFLSTVFFATESVAFWKMDSSEDPGAHNYCDPFFTTFAFWWNIVMSIVIVPLFLFPL